MVVARGAEELKFWSVAEKITADFCCNRKKLPLLIWKIIKKAQGADRAAMQRRCSWPLLRGHVLRGIVLLSALVSNVAGSAQSCSVDLSASKSKHDLRDELRVKMKELRALRDNGDVSESEYRQRKEKLRELGKSGGGSGVETPPLRNRKDGKTKKEKSVPIPHNFQKVTWDMVKNSFEIDSIEDPVRRALMSAISTALFVTVYGRTQVTSCHMDKLKFGSIFGEMLKDLNGEGGYEDSYMDFYFERSGIYPYCARDLFSCFGAVFGVDNRVLAGT